MDIFKLFYDHDQRLDNLSGDDKTRNEGGASLEDFLSPTPTFSRFYLTGTRLQEDKFGINKLEKCNQILEKLNSVFSDASIHLPSGTPVHLSQAIEQLLPESAIIISKGEGTDVDLGQLEIDGKSDVGLRNERLREILLAGHQVIFKEHARDGYDLHLFSKENIYPQLFYPLQELVDDFFRFFSINSKRMRSERHFYFETWTLDRPPHGAEEVFGDTKLRSKG
jgi:hypothetical protein